MHLCVSVIASMDNGPYIHFTYAEQVAPPAHANITIARGTWLMVIGAVLFCSGQLLFKIQ